MSARSRSKSADGTFEIGRDEFPQFDVFERLGVHVQSDRVRAANPDPDYVETALTALGEACQQLDVPEASIVFVDTVVPLRRSGCATASRARSRLITRRSSGSSPTGRPWPSSGMSFATRRPTSRLRAPTRPRSRRATPGRRRTLRWRSSTPPPRTASSNLVGTVSDERGRDMTVIDWLLDSDPVDPLAGHARPDATSRPTSSPPSAPGSRPRAGARGCSRSRRRTAGGAAGRGRTTGRTRSTCSSCCGGSGSIPRASRPGGRRSRPRARHVAGSRVRDPVGRQPVLRGRGRAVHQRQRRRDRRVLRRRHDAARRPAPRRAAPGRRLELRGRERRDGVVVRDDDQRPRGPARARAGDRRLGRGGARPAGAARSTCSSAGCSVGSRPAR